MDNKEQCRKLANRIYELDEKCIRLPVPVWENIYWGKGTRAG